MAEMPSVEEARRMRERAARVAVRGYLTDTPLAEQAMGAPPEEELPGVYATGSPDSPMGERVHTAMERASMTPKGGVNIMGEVALEAAGGPIVTGAVKTAAPYVLPVAGPVVEVAKKYGGRAKALARETLLGKEAAEEVGLDIPRVATHFSGTGTVEAALGKHKSVHAAEIDPVSIKAYNAAHGTDYKPRDVLSVDPQEVKGVDFYHASPVCKNLSCAKRGASIDVADQASADKVVQIIEEAAPPTLSIENVPGYQNTVLFDQISGALTQKGYTWDVGVYNAADYGGAQKRYRMIIRATKAAELPPLPEKTGSRDWFESVEDLIDDAPDMPLVSKGKGKENWELKRLRKAIESGRLDPNKPIITMGGSQQGSVYAVNAGVPSPTLTATGKSVPRIIMPDGRVKRVTGPMMRRLMGLPEDFVIPDNWGQAKEVLGNGVHGAVTEAIIAPLAKQGRALRQAGKAEEVVEGVAEQAATAGAKSADEATEAAKLWQEKGTESPYFKRWSGGLPVVRGGSRIPDEGAVVEAYHGGPEGIDAFLSYTHVGTEASAKQRVRYMTKGDVMGKAPTPGAKMEIYPVYARIKKPFRYTEKSSGFSAASDEESIVRSIEEALQKDALTDAAQRAGGWSKLAARFEADPYAFTRDFPDVDDFWFEINAKGLAEGTLDVQKWLIDTGRGQGVAFPNRERALELVARDRQGDFPPMEELAEFLREEGYDSLVYANRVEDKGKDSYILLDPTQIKSKFNRGTFDPKDPRIAYGAAPGAAALHEAGKDE